MNIIDEIRAAQAKGKTMPAHLRGAIVQHIAEQKRGGRRVPEVAAELGVNPKSLGYWRKKSKASLPVKFRAVVLAEPRRGEDFMLELGSLARVRGVSLEQLADLVRALR